MPVSAKPAKAAMRPEQVASWRRATRTAIVTRLADQTSTDTLAHSVGAIEQAIAAYEREDQGLFITILESLPRPPRMSVEEMLRRAKLLAEHAGLRLGADDSLIADIVAADGGDAASQADLLAADPAARGALHTGAVSAVLA